MKRTITINELDSNVPKTVITRKDDNDQITIQCTINSSNDTCDIADVTIQLINNDSVINLTDYSSNISSEGCGNHTINSDGDIRCICYGGKYFNIILNQSFINTYSDFDIKIKKEKYIDKITGYPYIYKVYNYVGNDETPIYCGKRVDLLKELAIATPYEPYMLINNEGQIIPIVLQEHNE